MDRELKIFVISPIGQDGSARRRDADDVKRELVDKAAQALKGHPVNPKYPNDGVYGNVLCTRGEAATEQKDIVIRIVDDIISADLVVAIVSEPNLNVFFELGIARSANSPVFVLKERRIEMPFDLRNHPYVEYRKEDVRRGDKSGAVIGTRAQLETLMRANLEKAHKNGPFDRPELGALGGSAVLDKFVQLNYSDWSRLILGGRREVWLAGLTLWELLRPNNTNFHLPKGSPEALIGDGDGDAHITELLMQQILTGKDVTVMLMDRANPALPHYAIRERRDGRDPSTEILKEISDEIEKSLASLPARFAPPRSADLQDRLDLPVAPGRWRLISVVDGMVPMRVTLTDNDCITSPFFHKITRSSGGPAIRAAGGSAWHTAVKEDLELLVSRQAAHADIGWRKVGLSR